MCLRGTATAPEAVRLTCAEAAMHGAKHWRRTAVVWKWVCLTPTRPRTHDTRWACIEDAAHVGYVKRSGWTCLYLVVVIRVVAPLCRHLHTHHRRKPAPTQRCSCLSPGQHTSIMRGPGRLLLRHADRTPHRKHTSTSSAASQHHMQRLLRT